MSTLCAYFVRPEKDEEWGVVAVAHSAREARLLAFPVLRSFTQVEWIETRALWLKEITVPDSVIAPGVWDECNRERWMCLAWEVTSWCLSCPHRRVRTGELGLMEVE